MAIGDVIIFCHDDIEFLSNGTPNYLVEDLEKYDVVGVAGTSRLLDGKWYSSGGKYAHGHVAHTADQGSRRYQVCVYGKNLSGPVVGNIQALDGLFFAVRKCVLNNVDFDESFNGFHLYDLDFTFTAYLCGFRLAIDRRISLLHRSGGRYDVNWKFYYDNFNRKYSNILLSQCMDPSPWIQRIDVEKKKDLGRVMRKLIK
jgi:hypothetical protein